MGFFKKLWGPSLDELASIEASLKRKNGISNVELDFENKESTKIINKFTIYLFCIIFFIIAFTSFYYVFWGNPFSSSGITLNEFKQIETGMTYSEVVNIIGEHGSLMSSVDLGIGPEYATQLYVWYGNDSISNANVMFQGGKAISKTQLGLR